MSNALSRSLIATLIVAGLAACGKDDSSSPTPEGPVVRATTANVFTPAQLTVDVGDQVTWIFGAVAHDVVFNMVAGAPANIEATAGRNVARTFSTAGTFPYQCTLHDGMTGSVVVQ